MDEFGVSFAVLLIYRELTKTLDQEESYILLHGSCEQPAAQLRF